MYERLNPAISRCSKNLLDRAIKTTLAEFFQNKYVKKLIPILVPGALAAALLPVFGPIAAGTATAVAIKNQFMVFPTPDYGLLGVSIQRRKHSFLRKVITIEAGLPIALSRSALRSL